MVVGGGVGFVLLLELLTFGVRAAEEDGAAFVCGAADEEEATGATVLTVIDTSVCCLRAAPRFVDDIEADEGCNPLLGFTWRLAWLVSITVGVGSGLSEA